MALLKGIGRKEPDNLKEVFLQKKKNETAFLTIWSSPPGCAPAENVFLALFPLPVKGTSFSDPEIVVLSAGRVF